MENQLPQTPSMNTIESMDSKTPSIQILKSDEKSPILVERTTPPLQILIFTENTCKNNNYPNPLNVPKAFKYPERYMSPTDQMVSPISKGLIARRRKVGPILPPALNPTKMVDQCCQSLGLSQN
ncbi:hypothetical protein ACHQM5_008772 [Ranunculus cassubicifolius]